jgi:protoporphyrinogen/coproporphyrinogen III oxidase
MVETTGVAVVGAGMTGLALGYHLSRAAVPHVVFEGSPRVGGVVRSGRVDGHLLEWGPQRTRLTAGVRELVDALGLHDQVITARPDLPLYVLRAGKLRQVPFSAPHFLRSDIVRFRDKLPLLLEPLRHGAVPEETVADYFTRKLGRGLYENLAGPLYGGLYASDPADMLVGLSLGHVLSEFGIGRSLILALLRRGGSIRPPAACSFIEGMEAFPRALYAANEANVRLAAPVNAVRREGSRWRVEWAGGLLEAERVVVTTPAAAAARLLAEFRAASSLSHLRYNPLAVVHLHAETALEGLGYQVGLAESLITRGVTFNDSLFGRRGVYTAYLGGARSRAAVEWRDEDLAEVAVREFEQATGFGATVLSVERETMPAWDSSWTALRGFTAPPGLRIAANWESRPGLPGRLAQAKRLASEFARELGSGTVAVDPPLDDRGAAGGPLART